MKKILFFASGTGTNVDNIIRHFKSHQDVSVVGIFSNNPEAKVLGIAKNHQVPSLVFTKAELNEGFILKNKRAAARFDCIGWFPMEIPEHIIARYSNKIINIHPALLPKYGGKGMYGMKVHQTVLDNKESKTGITIHYVNEHYDEGEFIFQETVTIEDCKTPEEIAFRVQELEHIHFPKTIEKLITHNS